LIGVTPQPLSIETLDKIKSAGYFDNAEVIAHILGNKPILVAAEPRHHHRVVIGPFPSALNQVRSWW